MSEDTSISLLSDPLERKKIVNRLRRAQGQLAAVVTALEEDEDCKNVMQQLSAVSKAIDRAGFLVIAGTLKECFIDDDSTSEQKTKEIEKMFLSLA